MPLRPAKGPVFACHVVATPKTSRPMNGTAPCSTARADGIGKDGRENRKEIKTQGGILHLSVAFRKDTRLITGLGAFSQACFAVHMRGGDWWRCAPPHSYRSPSCWWRCKGRCSHRQSCKCTCERSEKNRNRSGPVSRSTARDRGDGAGASAREPLQRGIKTSLRGLEAGIVPGARTSMSRALFRKIRKIRECLSRRRWSCRGSCS